MNAQEITKALGGQWHGSYGTAKCPSHDDREPSLSIRDGADGEVAAVRLSPTRALELAKDLTEPAVQSIKTSQWGGGWPG